MVKTNDLITGRGYIQSTVNSQKKKNKKKKKNVKMAIYS